MCYHGMPFTPKVPTALNAGIAIKCAECGKPCLIQATKNLSNENSMSMKRILNNFQYVCRTVQYDIIVDRLSHHGKI